ASGRGSGDSAVEVKDVPAATPVVPNESPVAAAPEQAAPDPRIGQPASFKFGKDTIEGSVDRVNPDGSLHVATSKGKGYDVAAKSVTINEPKESKDERQEATLPAEEEVGWKKVPMAGQGVGKAIKEIKEG